METQQTDHQDNLDFLSLQDCLNIIRARFPILALSTILCAMLGIYVIQVSPSIYRATATLQVASDNKSVLDVKEVEAVDLRSLQALGTIKHNVHRPSLIAIVLNVPEVQSHPQLIPPVVRWLAPFKPDPDLPPPSIEHYSDRELIDMASGWISVELIRSTRLIEVSVEHPNPKVAQLFANQLVAAYNKEATDRKNKNIQEALLFLKEETRKAGEALQVLATSVQIYNHARELKEDIRTRDEGIRALEQRYRDGHPKLIQARRLYDKIGEEFLEEYRKANLEIIRSTGGEVASNIVASAATAMRVSAGSFDKKRELELALSEFETRGSVLERDLNAHHQLYASLIKRMKEMDISDKLISSEVRLIEPASLPRGPVKPRKNVILVMSLLMGVGLGLGMIVTLHMLDNRFRTVEGLERETGLRVLAAIRSCRELDRNKKAKRAGLPPYLVDTTAYPAEMFRALRASLILMGLEEEEQKTIMVASSLAGEGKSTMSANLAAAFAEHNEKTILVDFDVRKSSIHNFFNVDRDAPGLADHLVNSRPLEECIHRTSHEKLDLLIAGEAETQSIQYIQEKSIGRILEELKSRYDRIIIDSAPILLVSESLFVASHADFVCFTVQASSTPKNAVKRALQLLHSIQVKPAGLIANRLRHVKKSSDYYGYGYGYGKY